MEGSAVFGEQSEFIGLLTKPLRQRGSGAEVQVITFLVHLFWGQGNFRWQNGRSEGLCFKTGKNLRTGQMLAC